MLNLKPSTQNLTMMAPSRLCKRRAMCRELLPFPMLVSSHTLKAHPHGHFGTSEASNRGANIFGFHLRQIQNNNNCSTQRTQLIFMLIQMVANDISL